MKHTMLAATLYAPGELCCEEVPIPVCGEDEVLLAVHYCGVCGSDVPRVLTKGTYRFPTIPGHELAGIIAYDPKGELEGRHASVFPLLPCGECEMCRRQTYELCGNYDYYGSRRDGGFAEYLAVKRWNLVLLPDSIPLQEAALCEPAAVAHHAVCKLSVQPGDHVLISGAGPIALLAALWLRAYGAGKIDLFDVVPEKITYAKSMGFEEYDGAPVDAALEGTGCGDALSCCLGALKPRGRIVLMGNPARAVEMSQETYWHILRKELFVTGTWNSSYGCEQSDWDATVKALEAGAVQTRPVISHIFPLDQANEAFRVLTDRRTFTNRVVLKTLQEG